MIRTTTASLAALAFCGCASQIGYHSGDLAEANHGLGDAVLRNIAAQTVNPEGSSADVVASGARVSRAVNAHASDTVEKPATASTTSAGASASAGQ